MHTSASSNTQNAALTNPCVDNSLDTGKIVARLENAKILHIWVQADTAAGNNGMSVEEQVPGWLLNSLAFDVDAFTGRLENFRTQARASFEAIWPEHTVHAVFDVELVARGMSSVEGAGPQDAEARAIKAEHQRDLLLAALKSLLEHEGSVVDTGIGQFPSEELESARWNAQIAIQEVAPE